MKFYHVSVVKIEVRDFLRSEKGYVCLATTLEQALYWGWTLYGNSLGELSRIYIYFVEVPDDAVVEDCRGHYHFEYRGIRKRASAVQPHTEDLDGEVVVRDPVKVVVVGKKEVSSQELKRWGEAHEAKLLSQFRIKEL